MFSKKWFFFIEGSILTGMAITGIIASALFPSMVAYMKRSRDAARSSHISMFSMAIQAYFLDQNIYPEPEGWCIPVTKITASYLPKGIPKDPIKGRLSGNCDGANGTNYGYGTYTRESGSSWYYMVADMETPASGNSDVLPTDGWQPVSETFFQNLQRWQWKYLIVSD